MIFQTNDCFRKAFKEPARYYYNVGGRWSAKTYESIQDIIFRLYAVPGSRAAFMRKVYGSIKDSLFQDTINILNSVGAEYTKTVSPLYIKLANGSDIVFKGADDPEKLKGLSSVDIVLADEANEFSENDFETIDQSIRGQHQENSIYLCHNPVPKIPGSQYWFERQFRVQKGHGKHLSYYDEALGSRVVSMRTTYQDNAKCPTHVKKRLEGYKKTNPSLYKLWALGEYAEMKGVILKGWDVVPEVPDGVDYLGYGVDFGFSEDPAAALKVYGNKGEIWVKGVVYSTDLTNDELHKKMIDGGISPNDKGIGDSAEPKTLETLRRMGLRGLRGAKKRANYKAGVANILKGMTIHLIDGDTDLQREFSTWSWDEDKTGKLLPRPKDGNDHYMDALVMFIHEYKGGGAMSFSKL